MLGFPSVAACQDAITSTEFNGWLAYDRLDPIRPNWARLFGTVAATIANVNRPKKSSKPYGWKDFFPEFKQRTFQDQTEQLAIVEALNAAFGGKDLRKKPPTA